MDTSPLGPILCLFSWDDVREASIDPARHLFCEDLLHNPQRAEALLGAVQFLICTPDDDDRDLLEIPEAVAFCQKLYREVTTLPWITSLSSKLFANIVACVPKEGTRLIRRDRSTTGTVVYDEAIMDQIILDMCNTVYEIAEKAGLPESVAQERCRQLRAYLPAGNLQ